MSETPRPVDLFLSPEAAVAWLAEAHEKFRGPFKDADFERLRKEIPDEPKNAQLGVRTPVWYDATVGDTFERQVALITYQYSEVGVWCWSELKSDPEHLRLLGGNKYHPGQCLRWETMDLDPVAERRQKPCDVRQPGRSPHAGVFATVAIHPQYGRGMNGDDKPYLWAPGYECTIPGLEQQLVPDVFFNRDSREVRLSAYLCDDAGGHWSVPAFLGSQN